MRARAGWIAVCCLCVAAVAFGQRITTSGDGVVGGPQTGTISNDVAHQTFTCFYTFPYVPSSTSSGAWKVVQTTAGGFTPTVGNGPVLEVGSDVSARRALWTEGTQVQLLYSGTKQGEYKLAFRAGAGNAVGGDGFFSLSVGDTSCYFTQKKPDAFGVLFAGANRAGYPADLPLDTWVGFVGNGSDTTYIPLGTAPTAKFYIHANAAGGAVQFYMDDVLVGTITSPVRSTNSDLTGLSFWFAGDAVNAGGVLAVGPVAIERPWH